MLKASILLLLLVGLSHQATVTPCGVPSLRDDMKCFMQLVDFLKNSFLVILKSTDRARDFKNSCDSLQNCYSSLECRKNDPNVMDLQRKVNTYCDSMLYISTDFVECNKKLDQKRSQCWSTYFPAPDRSCSNVFGQEDCVKREIIETCGQQDWIGFRDVRNKNLKVS
uniref:DUF19 domain-containing protein n=1 Tax=Caenorhabditis tropicalis TaxID=1561998 RepID=A0A1I7V2B4_9PELO